MEEIKQFVLETIREGTSAPQEILDKMRERFPNESVGRVFGIVRNQLKKEGLIINLSRGVWTAVVKNTFPVDSSGDF